MPDLIAVLLYLVSLFFLGIGNAVVIYHILRYRDADDNSGIVLIIYLILVVLVMIGTAVLVDWGQLFS